MCELLLVINTNLHPVWHSFHVVADYWSKMRFRPESTSTMYLSHSLGVNNWTCEHEICFQETRNTRMLQNTSWYLESFRRGSRLRRTDEQTEPLLAATRASQHA